MANVLSCLKNKLKVYITWKNACLFLLIAYSAIILPRAFLGDIRYDEIDSNGLPVISLQYRASIIINKSDILQAQKDFPEFYTGIEDYDDLRSSKLVKISDDNWMAYYFPIYPFTCIPVKLLFSMIGVSQSRTFTVTNALLVILVLTVIYKKLNTSYSNIFFALAFIICSPITLYVNYINYETFIFSMVTLSMVMFVNDRRNLSALFLSMAGMANSAIMAVGLVMIFAYCINVLRKDLKNGVKLLVVNNWKETLLYALCFVPCLIPFIIQKILLSSSIFGVSSDSFANYSDRVLAYWLDTNLGVNSFAPLQVILWAIIVILAILQKKWRVLLECSFGLIAIMGVSLMYHINCGMLYCARYIVWIYPFIAISVAINADKVINRKVLVNISSILAVCLSLSLMIVNTHPLTHYVFFNNMTQVILDNVPQIYNPYYATFVSRANHVDGGYVYNAPVYYCDSSDNNLRKVLYRASAEDIECVKNDLKGSEDNLQHFYEILDKAELDGKLHYMNISRASAYQIEIKTELDKLIEKYENADSEEIINESNIFMDGNDSLYQFSYQTELQSNTMYRITLKLPENFDFDNSEIFFIDFYGGPEYDSPEQEISDFLKKGQYEYTFFLNSGDVPSEVADIRIINFVRQQNIDTNIVIEHFKVEKLDSSPETVILSEKPMLRFNGSYYEAGYPIELMDNTNYTINIEMSGDFIPNDAEAFFVDFYGGSEYDAAEQEISLLNEEQKKEYTFTINSGDVPDVQTYVRIVYFDSSSEEQAPIVECIENFEVSEAA